MILQILSETYAFNVDGQLSPGPALIEIDFNLILPVKLHDNKELNTCSIKVYFAYSIDNSIAYGIKIINCSSISLSTC